MNSVLRAISHSSNHNLSVYCRLKWLIYDAHFLGLDCPKLWVPKHPLLVTSHQHSRSWSAGDQTGAGWCHTQATYPGCSPALSHPDERSESHQREIWVSVSRHRGLFNSIVKLRVLSQLPVNSWLTLLKLTKPEDPEIRVVYAWSTHPPPSLLFWAVTC